LRSKIFWSETPAGIGYLAQTLQEEGIEYVVLDMATGCDMDTLKTKLSSFKPDLLP